MTELLTVGTQCGALGLFLTDVTQGKDLHHGEHRVHREFLKGFLSALCGEMKVGKVSY